EELETMNEELQSTNEELETLNDELRQRTFELNDVNAFLETILTSLGIAVVVLNPAQQVRIWNEHSERMWGLRSDGVEGQRCGASAPNLTQLGSNPRGGRRCRARPPGLFGSCAEVQRAGVDAEAHPAAVARAVVEDVAEVAAAAPADDLGARHAVGAVAPHLD